MASILVKYRPEENKGKQMTYYQMPDGTITFNRKEAQGYDNA